MTVTPHFQVPVDTVLFYPGKKDKLFKINIKSHKNNKTEITHTRSYNLGPNFDERVCLQSIWANAPFISLLSNKKIPRDIAARIDEIDLIGETETISNSTEGSLGA